MEEMVSRQITFNLGRSNIIAS
jgi:hypothetical protein